VDEQCCGHGADVARLEGDGASDLLAESLGFLGVPDRGA
jgi:hypothetical protein